MNAVPVLFILCILSRMFGPQAVPFLLVLCILVWRILSVTGGGDGLMGETAAPAEAIRRNLDGVRSRLARALERAGRPPDACRLLAVTKLRSPAEIAALASGGQSEFGENRVQEAAAKIPEVASLLEAGATSGRDARWHLVGHLQRNKARKAVELFEVIHSVDSVRLLDALARAARAAGRTPAIMLEANVSGEESKYGLRPDEIEEVLRRAAELASVKVTGLMTMAPFVDDPGTVRPVFAGLRELMDRLNDTGAYPAPLTELSMGMTQDFEVAAEEGATVVRVGTALFQE